MTQNIIININDKIAEITLNRPERMNAITTELLEELKNALLSLSLIHI